MEFYRGDETKMFRNNIPQMIGLRLYNLQKCYLLNTKGVVSQQRDYPLSNLFYNNAPAYLKSKVYFLCKFPKKRHKTTIYHGLYYRLLLWENK